MPFLTAAELPTYYENNMSESDVTKYLYRANAYCYGVIGGEPPNVDDNLKAIVAHAFEILAEGQTTQTDPVTGNITEAAPTSAFNRSDRNANPLAAVDKMLMPYKKAYDDAHAEQSDNGVTWLGR